MFEIDQASRNVLAKHADVLVRNVNVNPNVANENLPVGSPNNECPSGQGRTADARTSPKVSVEESG